MSTARWLSSVTNYLGKRAKHEIIIDGVPHITRLHIFRSKWLSINLYQYHSSKPEERTPEADGDNYVRSNVKQFHTHWWNNISFPLTNGIREHHIDGTYTDLPRFRPYFRPAGKPHRITIKGESFSLFINFRRKNEMHFIEAKSQVFLGENLDDTELTGHILPRHKD